MASDNGFGAVGIIRPTTRAGGFDDLLEILPEGIGVTAAFAANPAAEAVYMLGPAWRALDIIERLERDLGTPVMHAVPAQCWDIQRHLHVRQPVKGFGRLIAEMPK